MYIHPVLRLMGIKHISVSHIQAWNASPAAWACRYLFDIKQPASESMNRGKLVENMILDSLLINVDFDDSKHDDLKSTLSEKNLKTALYMAENGRDALDKFINDRDCLIRTTQLKLSREYLHLGDEQLPARMLGFADALLSDGCFVEIKTTSRAPTGDEPSLPHLQQLSSYICTAYIERSISAVNSYVTKFAPYPSGMIMYCLSRKENPIIMREMTHDAGGLKDVLANGTYNAYWIDQSFEQVVLRYRNFLDLFLPVCSRISDYSDGKRYSEYDLFNEDFGQPTEEQQKILRQEICRVIPIDFEHYRMSGLSPSHVREMFDSGICDEDPTLI